MKKGLKKYNKNGSGCKDECPKLHPINRMCRKSLRGGKCDKINCYFTHIKGTQTVPPKAAPAPTINQSTPLAPNNQAPSASVAAGQTCPTTVQTPPSNSTSYANVVSGSQPYANGLFLEMRSLGQMMAALLSKMDAMATATQP